MWATVGRHQTRPGSASVQINYDGANGGGQAFWNKAHVTDDTLATLATGVAAIQFNFDLPVENGHVGYRELDVFGSATTAAVPEPSTTALLGLGALALALRRRK